jgi:hypothetical protein
MLQSYPYYIPKDRGAGIIPNVNTVAGILEPAKNSTSFVSGADTAEAILYILNVKRREMFTT